MHRGTYTVQFLVGILLAIENGLQVVVLLTNQYAVYSLQVAYR